MSQTFELSLYLNQCTQGEISCIWTWKTESANLFRCILVLKPVAKTARDFEVERNNIYTGIKQQDGIMDAARDIDVD